ncbi:MAG: LuxR C-terminal-related transcriptional regulator [Verrucomicrobiota bacterium]
MAASPRSPLVAVDPQSKRKRRGLLHVSPQIDALLLRLHASADIQEFWAAVLEILRETTPHDAVVAYLNFLDFATSWQATEILATPNAQRSLKWFRNRRAVDMTPRFVLSQPKKIKVYRLSDVVPDRAELLQSEFFKKFLAPGGWHHLAVSLYWRGDRVGSQIAIRRTEKQGDFTAAEIELLEAIHPHIETVLHRLLTLEEERARRRTLESFNQHLPFALLFLDWELAMLHVNQSGLELCSRWNFGVEKARAYQPRAVFAIPAEILQSCAALKAAWLEQQSSGSVEVGQLGAAKVEHPVQRGLTATIRLHVEEHSRAAYPGFIIYLEDRSTLPALERLASHSLLAQLTEAEREIAYRVGEGMGNDEIARRLRKSVKTVKAQLTSIYKKLGVSGRSQFLVRLR